VPCDLTAIRLHAYLDGELDAASAASFEQHLRTCAECSSTLPAEQSLREALSAAQLYERAPTQLRNQIRKNLPASVIPKAPKYPAWQWLAVAAALLLAAFLGRELVGLFHVQSQRSILASAAVDAHLRSLQPGHLTDVQSSDQHTVKPWFDGKVDFAPTVRDFAADGFPLLGGRLDVLAGRTAAALVYGRRKHIINVFVMESSYAAQLATSGELHGYHWLSWQKDGFTYIAVSDAATEDLSGLRDLFLKPPTPPVTPGPE
jgi:anti-sigma factor (TIGR02949 family)